MIISCPACATRYVVPDSAIGLEGRTVRCAKCKHSWYQDGPELAEPIDAAYMAAPADTGRAAAQPAATSTPAATDTPPVHRREPVASASEPPAPALAREVPPAEQAEGSLPDQGTAADVKPAPDLPSFREPSPVEWDASAEAEDGVSQFDHGPPFRPRRNWLRWMSWGAAIFAVLAIAAAAAMSTLGVPSWLPIEKPLFGADPGLKVEFPASEQERRTLPNGAEFFGARVVVKNEARETRTVPPLLIVLRDARERVVYSWELIPPQRSLAPGEAMTINEAMTDVPKSAVYADIGWAPR